MATTLRPRDFAMRLELTPLLQGLDPPVLLAIAERSTMRSLRKSQVLWRQGAHAYELAFVWSGQLQVVRNIGKRVSFRAVLQNETIGVSNAMGLSPCTVDVIAAEATRVLLVPGEMLRSLVPKYPEIAFRALDYMGALLGRMSDEVELLHTGTLEERVLKRLHTLARGRLEIAITHEELAQQVAARRESVSRVLSALESRGMIRCRRGRIEWVSLGRER